MRVTNTTSGKTIFVLTHRVMKSKILVQVLKRMHSMSISQQIWMQIQVVVISIMEWMPQNRFRSLVQKSDLVSDIHLLHSRVLQRNSPSAISLANKESPTTKPLICKKELIKQIAQQISKVCTKRTTSRYFLTKDCKISANSSNQQISISNRCEWPNSRQSGPTN